MAGARWRNCGSLIFFLLLIPIGFLLLSTAVQPAPERPDESGSRAEIRPSAANRSVESLVLLYNRVPKCGSSTVLALLRKLAKQNKFHTKSSRTYFSRDLSLQQRAEMTTFIARINKRTLFDRHFYYFDLAR